MRWPLRWIDSHYNHVLLASAETKSHEGLQLYALYSEDAAAFFATAIKVIELIKSIDARRFKRVKKYIPNIALVRFGSDHYKHSAKAFYVNEFDVNNVELFAASLIHEATHGLLMTKAIGYELAQERHERVCVREEVRFFKKAINLRKDLSDEHKKSRIQDYEDQIARGFEIEWWDKKVQHEKRFNKLKEVLGWDADLKFHDSKGNLLYSNHYKDGQLNGCSRFYYPKGELQDEIYYANGLMHGQRRLFFENGKPEQIVNYKMGVAHGEIKSFFKNGNL